MDYFELLKRAWNITWRYRALWVLGLFAGVASGSSGGGNSYSSGSGDTSGRGAEALAQIEHWAYDNIALIAVIAGVVFIISMAMWVLSVAAQGGLVHGTNEAAEGRSPSLGASWSVGFAKWGRTFMVQFVLGLPLLVLIVVLGVIVFASAAGGLASGDDIGIAAGSAGLCIVMPVLLIAVIAGAFLIGLIAPVALRYGVLNDITFGQAIKRAWDDLWAKKGVFVFWLVMLLPGMAYAAIAMVLVIPAAIAIMMLAIAGQVIIAMMVGFFLVLLMLVPNAIYATFVNAAWTLFFRQMTGMEPLRAAVTPGGPQYPAAPTTYAPAAYAPGPVVEVAAPAEMPAETPVAYDAPAIGTSTTEEPPPSDG